MRDTYRLKIFSFQGYKTFCRYIGKVLSLFELKSEVLDSYKTITAPSEGIYKEKGSKFISFAYPVFSESEALTLVESLKKEHYSARHHCFAWRLGFSGARTRAVDDGEPSSTAGRPILGQLLSYGVTNVLIVVVRYFGGVKLGVGGLIQAYKEAARDALSHAEVVDRKIEACYTLTFPYLSMNEVMKMVKEFQPRVLSQRFDNSCNMTLSIGRDLEERLKERMEQISDITVEFCGYE